MTAPILAARRPSPGRLYAAALAATYALLVCGTAAGWLVPGVRLLNVLMMAVLIALWVRSLSRGMDEIDGASIIVLVAAGIATVGSIVPRLSADAFFAALAIAAVFGLVRRMGPSGRDPTVKAMALVGSVIAAIFLVLWVMTWLEWTRTTGSAPSLSLELPSAPFGQRHNVALLLALLVPAAALAGALNRRTNLMAVGALMMIAAAVVFMSGGRAVWLGAGVASFAALAFSDRSRGALLWLQRRWVAVTVGGLVLAAALVISGIGGSLVARAVATDSLGMRGAIWGSALTEWSDRPIIGTGLGMFQFGLQATDYFDRSVFAPKHADNLYLQTLSEVGIIGSASLIVLVIAIARSWRRVKPSTPIVWALVFVAVAGIGANPAALGYCAILIVFWAGMSAPWAPVAPRRMPRWVGVAAPAVLAIVVAVPILTTTVATLAFDRAREQSDAGTFGAAMQSLDEAVMSDPTFPLYRRERGILLLRTGRTAEALSDLQHAAQLNPLDDTTYRALALASLEARRIGDALAAAQTAAELQATDGMNQAVLALVADAADASVERDEALARLLAIAPWSAADESWQPTYPDSEPSSSLRDAALLVGDRPLADTIDQRWTLALAGVPEVTRSAGYSASQEAFAHLVACRPAEALQVIDGATTADRSDSHYAFARAVVARLNGEPSEPTNAPADPLAGPALGDPVGDQARYARRSPQPGGEIRLPSNNGGRLAWLDDPDRALRLTRGSPCP